MAADMQTIRQNIFQSPTGTIDSTSFQFTYISSAQRSLDVEELATDAGAYGMSLVNEYCLRSLMAVKALMRVLGIS